MPLGFLDRSRWRATLSSMSVPVYSVLASLAVSAVLIAVIGINPLEAYYHLLDGAFGSRYSLGDTLVRSIPLMFTGLSVAFARRCGMLNIGAEGQLYAGALSATVVALVFDGSPLLISLTLATLAGFLGGGLWGAIPGLLKVRLGVSEIINTIMMNYIAIFGVTYLLLNSKLRDVSDWYPQSPMLEQARYPILLAGTRLHAGLIVAMLCVVLAHFVLWRTTLGYQIRAVGLNAEAARYGGINVSRNMVIAMLFAGGFGGLAGASEILGVQHRLISEFSIGVGYRGIAVALLGQSTPAGVVLAALLFGAVQTGANMMQRATGVPITIINVMQGLVVLFVVGARNLKYLTGWWQRVRPVKRGEAA